MRHFRTMVFPYLVWIAIMIVLPMLLIVLYAFTVRGNDVTTFRFTLENFAYFFSDAIFLDVLKRSLLIALATTAICVVIGYPTAYFIANALPTWHMRLVLLVTLPTWINMLVRTYAWMGILQDNGLINTFLEMIGLAPVKLLHTSFAVVLGMVYNFLPFMILQIHTSLTSKLAGSSQRFGRQQCTTVFAGNAALIFAGGHQWDYVGIPAGRVQFLYPQAVGWRTICADRECD